MIKACCLNLWHLRFASSFTKRQNERGSPQESPLANQICFCIANMLQCSCAADSCLLSIHMAHSKAWLTFEHSIKNLWAAANSAVSLHMSSACYMQHIFPLFPANNNLIICLRLFCSLTFQSVLPSTELQNNIIKWHLKRKRESGKLIFHEV